jgi:hypothetical protein
VFSVGWGEVFQVCEQQEFQGFRKMEDKEGFVSGSSEFQMILSWKTVGTLGNFHADLLWKYSNRFCEPPICSRTFKSNEKMNSLEEHANMYRKCTRRNMGLCHRRDACDLSKL